MKKTCMIATRIHEHGTVGNTSGFVPSFFFLLLLLFSVCVHIYIYIYI